LRVPLIVLVIPPAFTCGKGAAASDYELEHRALLHMQSGVIS